MKIINGIPFEVNDESSLFCVQKRKLQNPNGLLNKLYTRVKYATKYMSKIFYPVKTKKYNRRFVDSQTR